MGRGKNKERCVMFFFVCMCDVWVGIYAGVYMKVREKLSEVSILSSFNEFQEPSSHRQAYESDAIICWTKSLLLCDIFYQVCFELHISEFDS